MTLERINEAHPLFKNIVGSIKNHSLDSYTVAGDASVNYKYEEGKQIRVRKVNDLKEVSRTSFPADPGATINGLFFVKMKILGWLKDLIKEHKGLILNLKSKSLK